MPINKKTLAALLGTSLATSAMGAEPQPGALSIYLSSTSINNIAQTFIPLFTAFNVND